MRVWRGVMVNVTLTLVSILALWALEKSWYDFLMLTPLIARRLLAERVLLLQPPLGLKVDPPVDVARDHASNVVVFRSDSKIVPPSVRKVAVGWDVLLLW